MNQYKKASAHTPFTITHASTFLQRLKGLLGTQRLAFNQGLYIARCNSVHTFFMRYAIDVVFVDAHHRVRKVVPALKPWRAAACWRASAVLELAAGAAAMHGLRPGTDLSIWIATYPQAAAAAPHPTHLTHSTHPTHPA
jgi:uncharacterized protein